MKKIILTIMLLFFIHSFGFCQEHSWVLRTLECSDSRDPAAFLKTSNEKFTSKEQALVRLENKISKLKQKGYLEANVDSIFYRKDTIFARVHFGEKYDWAEIRFSDIDSLNFNGFNSRTFSKKRKLIGFSDLSVFQNEILEHLGDNGYPFAQLEVEEIKITDKEIRGLWKIHAKDLILWDSIVLKGTTIVKRKFLEKYLGIKPNRVYQEKVSKSISEKINNLSFAKEIKASEIEFDKGKARVYTYLEKQAANQFDGIIGFQSNKDENKLELTGEVKLLLENTFSAGESIRFNWQKFEESSQNLFLGLVYPYLFSSNFGIDFGFGIQKQDSSYLNITLDAGLRFSQAGKNYMKLFFKLNSSSLISTNHLRSASVLPNYADVRSYLFGFGYHFENLDYSFNPKKGWNIDLAIGTGTHRLKKNSNIPEKLYENTDLSGNLVDTQWKFEYNHPITENLSFRLRNKGGIIDAPDLFQNDLFKLGGMSTLRGFNEDSFRASMFSVMTTELRFIPQKNSSFYLFWDGGYYKNNLLNKKTEDYPWGIGFGLNFGTKSGIFSLNYAVGKQKNENVDLQAAKVHFGFVSRF